MAVLDHRDGLGLGPDATRRSAGIRHRDALRRGRRRPPRVALAAPVRASAASASTSVAAVLAGGVAFATHLGGLRTRPPTSSPPSLLPFLWVLAVALNRAYESRFLGVGSEEFRRVARAGVALTALVAFTAYVTDTSSRPPLRAHQPPAGHRR